MIVSKGHCKVRTKTDVLFIGDEMKQTCPKHRQVERRQEGAEIPKISNPKGSQGLGFRV